ncbi:MAG: 2-phosphosulfolactate phosphatase [Bacteroidetes bacterium]|nr:2-phosphosulfolactate phosphatase [Bacteroidota bacterium]
MVSLFDLRKSAVVVIDVYRATSAITAALASGVKEVIPVGTVEEAKAYKAKGFLAAAERKGAVVKGFDLGNSPIALSQAEHKGKSIVLTTSNGTKALLKTEGAKEVIIASFLNEQAVVNYLAEHHNNVIFLCAGWKDRFNLEDTAVAGAISRGLEAKGWHTHCDSALAAMHLFDIAKDRMPEFMKNASHTTRLGHLGLSDDLAFCNRRNEYNIVPVYENGTIRLK